MKKSHIILGLIIFLTLEIIFTLLSTMTLNYKPAIYLYPEKPTKINIILSQSIKINVNVPNYVSGKGWHVLAYPDGKITDLQPQYTDCNKINSKQFGMEYAKKACETNNYPYVYWDGIQLLKPVPNKNEGWIVEKKDLSKFFEEKLDYIGFNKQEKDEFLYYWVHKLSDLNNNKFFIYFLQNEELDSYLPMQIKPEPDSTNRIYIVVKKLDTNYKNKNISSQKLKKIVRKGFTLVDWGGMIK